MAGSCIACGILKDSNNTWVSKTTGRFHSYCRSCHSDKQKQYRLLNKEKARAYQKEYYKENKSYLNEYNREWQKKNPHVNRESSKRWRLKYPDRNAANTSRYSKRVRRATPPWLTEDNWDSINYKYMIAKDASLISGEKYHVDHIVPLLGKNICGLHVPWNLQVLPADVNIKKSNKTEQDKVS